MIKNPLLQKIPLFKGESFVARTFQTPDFEVGWHQHAEIELILFTRGSGLSFIGNHVGQWQKGDVYLLGSGLPHSFQKGSADTDAAAVVVQFLVDFWGTNFLALPENRELVDLLRLADAGLKVASKNRPVLAALIGDLEHCSGLRRVLQLGDCLDHIMTAGNYRVVCETNRQLSSKKQNPTLEKVFNFTIENFKSTIALADVSSLACMSTSAFCNWFKKSTKKTYVDFLNEIRIGYACNQLRDSISPVPVIGYDAGFNTSANFYKQFLKLVGLSPLQYRKQFAAGFTGNQRNIHTVHPDEVGHYALSTRS